MTGHGRRNRSFFAGALGIALTVVVAACSTSASTPDRRTCGTAAVSCNGACTTLVDDNSNCGACGHACATGERCTGGFCLTPCPTGTSACGARCVAIMADHENCGACGQACGSGEVCSAGKCDASCAPGTTLCDLGGDAGVTRACVDLQHDNGSCGACGKACTLHEKCTGGACVALCNDNETACNGTCIDTRGSPTSCGACNVPCVGSDRCVLSVCRPESKVVFLTSTKSRGNLGGLAGADTTCNALAHAAGLTGTYAAWLSTDNASAASRLTHSSLPYRLPDGTLVANGWNGLTTSLLLHAIDQTELGAPAPEDCLNCRISVYTDTTEAGDTSSPGHDCFGWTSESNLVSTGIVGYPGNTYWSQYGWGAGCEFAHRLYCFEQ